METKNQNYTHIVMGKYYIAIYDTPKKEVNGKLSGK